MHLLQSGVPLEIIRDFLGHVDVKTTEIYYRQKVFMHSSQGKGFVGKASALVFCT
jgi:integrase